MLESDVAQLLGKVSDLTDRLIVLEKHEHVRQRKKDKRAYVCETVTNACKGKNAMMEWQAYKVRTEAEQEWEINNKE